MRRLFLRTWRPPGVAIRALKPMVLARFRRFGLKVGNMNKYYICYPLRMSTNAKGDTTTLEDFSILQKLQAEEEA